MGGAAGCTLRRGLLECLQEAGWPGTTDLQTARLRLMCCAAPRPPPLWRRWCVQYGLLSQEDAEQWVLEQAQVRQDGWVWVG